METVNVSWVEKRNNQQQGDKTSIQDFWNFWRLWALKRCSLRTLQYVELSLLLQIISLKWVTFAAAWLCSSLFLQIGIDAKHVRLPSSATQEEVGKTSLPILIICTSGQKFLTASCRPAGVAEHHVCKWKPVCAWSDRPAASGLSQQNRHRAHHQRRFSGQRCGRVGSAQPDLFFFPSELHHP